MAIEIRNHMLPSSLTTIFLSKPTRDRRLQICQSVKASVAENNVHRAATAEAESVNHPWSASLPAMLTSASIAHIGRIANAVFEASAGSGIRLPKRAHNRY